MVKLFPMQDFKYPSASSRRSERIRKRDGPKLLKELVSSVAPCVEEEISDFWDYHVKPSSRWNYEEMCLLEAALARALDYAGGHELDMKSVQIYVKVSLMCDYMDLCLSQSKDAAYLIKKEFEEKTKPGSKEFDDKVNAKFMSLVFPDVSLDM